jgi:hypothetical protein
MNKCNIVIWLWLGQWNFFLYAWDLRKEVLWKKNVNFRLHQSAEVQIYLRLFLSDKILYHLTAPFCWERGWVGGSEFVFMSRTRSTSSSHPPARLRYFPIRAQRKHTKVEYDVSFRDVHCPRGGNQSAL